MKHYSFGRLGVALLFVCASVLSHAQSVATSVDQIAVNSLYIGYRGGFAVSDIDVNAAAFAGEEDLDLTHGVLIGYQFASPWSLQAFWQDAGSAEVISRTTGNTSGIVDISVVGAGALYRYQYRPAIEWYVETGVASLTTRYRFVAVSDNDDVQPYFGAGLRWSPWRSWQLGAGYTFYSTELQIATLGIIRHFQLGRRPPPVAELAANNVDSAQCADLTLDFKGIEFAKASTALTEQARLRLKNLASQLLGLPAAIDIEIRAYADEQGSESYNYALSLVRARTVRDYLVSQGVARQRINAEAYGEWGLPGAEASNNITPLSAEYYRRAEVRLLGREDYIEQHPHCQAARP